MSRDPEWRHRYPESRPRLPSKHEHHAPQWDRSPRSLQSFLDDYSDLCDRFGILDDDERKITTLLRYAPTSDVRYMWKMLRTDHGIDADWKEYRRILVENTPGTGEDYFYTTADLEELVCTSRLAPMRTLEHFNTYWQRFVVVSEFLRARSRISEAGQYEALVYGLPEELRHRFRAQVRAEYPRHYPEDPLPIKEAFRITSFLLTTYDADADNTKHGSHSSACPRSGPLQGRVPSQSHIEGPVADAMSTADSARALANAVDSLAKSMHAFGDVWSHGCHPQQVYPEVPRRTRSPETPPRMTSRDQHSAAPSPRSPANSSSRIELSRGPATERSPSPPEILQTLSSPPRRRHDLYVNKIFSTTLGASTDDAQDEIIALEKSLRENQRKLEAARRKALLLSEIRVKNSKKIVVESEDTTKSEELYSTSLVLESTGYPNMPNRTDPTTPQARQLDSLAPLTYPPSPSPILIEPRLATSLNTRHSLSSPPPSSLPLAEPQCLVPHPLVPVHTTSPAHLEPLFCGHSLRASQPSAPIENHLVEAASSTAQTSLAVVNYRSPSPRPFVAVQPKPMGCINSMDPEHTSFPMAESPFAEPQSVLDKSHRPTESSSQTSSTYAEYEPPIETVSLGLPLSASSPSLDFSTPAESKPITPVLPRPSPLHSETLTLLHYGAPPHGRPSNKLIGDRNRRVFDPGGDLNEPTVDNMPSPFIPSPTALVCAEPPLNLKALPFGLADLCHGYHDLCIALPDIITHAERTLVDPGGKLSGPILVDPGGYSLAHQFSLSTFDSEQTLPLYLPFAFDPPLPTHLSLDFVLTPSQNEKVPGRCGDAYAPGREVPNYRLLPD